MNSLQGRKRHSRRTIHRHQLVWRPQNKFAATLLIITAASNPHTHGAPCRCLWFFFLFSRQRAGKKGAERKVVLTLRSSVNAVYLRRAATYKTVLSVGGWMNNIIMTTRCNNFIKRVLGAPAALRASNGVRRGKKELKVWLLLLKGKRAIFVVIVVSLIGVET